MVTQEKKKREEEEELGEPRGELIFGLPVGLCLAFRSAALFPLSPTSRTCPFQLLQRSTLPELEASGSNYLVRIATGKYLVTDGSCFR